MEAAKASLQKSQEDTHGTAEMCGPEGYTDGQRQRQGERLA